MAQKRVVPIDGSTVSHHAIITLAIRLSCSAVASGSHCQASLGGCSKLRRSIVSSLGHDRPSDARHLVGNGNGDELGSAAGPKRHDWAALRLFGAGSRSGGHLLPFSTPGLSCRRRHAGRNAFAPRNCRRDLDPGRGVRRAVSRLALACRPDADPGARRLAYAGVAAPTLYVLLGVVRALIHSPIPDEIVWCVLWLASAIWSQTARNPVAATRPTVGRWRIVHGMTAAVLCLYVAFHLANHLFGLLGPDAYAAVMKIGRVVYRSGVGEPLLVAAMLFQIGTGLSLA